MIKCVTRCVLLIVQNRAGLLGKVTPELQPSIELVQTVAALRHTIQGVLPVLFTADLLCPCGFGLIGSGSSMLLTNMNTEGMGCGEILSTFRAGTTEASNFTNLTEANTMHRRLCRSRALC